jgi:pimeloyl-ACP methyl ester carboxylesterase
VRLFLVHGSIANGLATWAAQRPLEQRFDVVVWNRPGYPPNDPVERIDFEEQAGELAALLEPGDHLCGHSYGGVISLLAAAARPDLASLTVVEPPAFGIARGQPAVDRLVEQFERFFAAGPHEPVAYLRGFLPIVGSDMRIPDRLPPELEQGTRAAIAERPPWEAVIPFAALRAAPFPKLVVSGRHAAAFEAVCDVLESELVAERAVLHGAGHSVPRLGEPFNRVLAEFVERAEAQAARAAPPPA